jgi:elongation factor G
MKIRVFDGSFHAVDSDAMSFELCAKQGFREAAPQSKAGITGANHADRSNYAGPYMGDVTVT